MASNRLSLEEYVDVAERIQDFKDAHPKGSLQTLGWEIVTVSGTDPKTAKPVTQTFIVYRAAAFREGSDPRPGHGIAWEPFPGRTPYTKDSELMNAETAAWGRAICALGLVSNRSLASRQEVRNRRADQDAEQEPKETPVPHASVAPKDATVISADVLDQLRESFNASDTTEDQFPWMLLSVGVQSLPANPSRADVKKAMESLTLEQAFKLDALLKGKDDAVPESGEAS